MLMPKPCSGLDKTLFLVVLYALSLMNIDILTIMQRQQFYPITPIQLIKITKAFRLLFAEDEAFSLI